MPAPPRHIRSDKGPEFVARVILRRLGQANIEAASIYSGKPWQNAAGRASTASSATNA